MSLFSFLKAEFFRGYVLEREEERFNRRREKVYNFMSIPNQVERFMAYGFFQCADSFLYLYTYLPLRLISVLLTCLTRPFSFCFRNSKRKRLLASHEIVDILKALIIILATLCMLQVDTAVLYHLIKSQSIIKLYIFYNMLEVADRLCSVFGQDIVDSLFWTATEPRGRKREHLGVIPHFILALVYIVLHTTLVLCQATTLNVAINSSNKSLLTIMMSNNFVELKGSVFKKFDKNNLFQLSCADVRERFHLFILQAVVVLQTMREYAWKEDCAVILVTELFIDWVKHAFITRFNDIPLEVYKDYTTSLAYDLADTKQKYAYTDHSDIVARRMGFIPIPLAVLVMRIAYQALNITDLSGVIVLCFFFVAVFSFKILINIVLLGKACELIDSHRSSHPPTKSKVEADDIFIEEVEREALIGLKVRSKSVCSLPVEPIVVPKSPKGRSMSQSPVRRRKVRIDEKVHSEDTQTVFVDDSLPGLLIKDTSSKPMFYNSTVSLQSVRLNSSVSNSDGIDSSFDHSDQKDDDLSSSSELPPVPSNDEKVLL